MALGATIKELRDKLGWKQVTLAKNSGIPQATVSRIESGRVTQPKLDQLRKLARALGTTIDYLVEDRDDPAQVVFEGWGWLSAAEQGLLATLVRFFEHEHEASKGEQE